RQLGVPLLAGVGEYLVASLLRLPLDPGLLTDVLLAAHLALRAGRFECVEPRPLELLDLGDLLGGLDAHALRDLDLLREREVAVCLRGGLGVLRVLRAEGEPLLLLL